MGYKTLRTPLIKPRATGGTFYTFNSALEDIGLNINELKNTVSISHYALLDLPEFNTFLDTMSGFSDSSVNVGDYRFAEGFQNYVLNLETVLRNRPTYDFSNTVTVSERCFWKWLQKSCMSLSRDYTLPDTEYYVDTQEVVKGFGYISSGTQRSDDYSMYNETFVQIPSSFGQMKVLFKHTNDLNYYDSSLHLESSNSNGYLEHIPADEIYNDRLIETGLSAKGFFDGSTATSYYYTIGNMDNMTIELDIDKLRKYYGDTTSSLTYDDIAINKSIRDTYKFNAIILFYSIYDETSKNIIATNAYGLLLLNNAEISGSGHRFPSLVKKKSTSTTTGTSFSFRLNLKVSSVYGGNTVIVDNSTPAYSMSTDFNDVVKNLNTAINIMKSNANYLAKVQSTNENIKRLALDALDKVNDLEACVESIKKGEYGDINAENIKCNIISPNGLNAGVVIYDNSNNIIGGIYNNGINSDNIKGNTAEIKKVSSNYTVTKNLMFDGSMNICSSDSEYYPFATILPGSELINGMLCATATNADTSIYTPFSVNNVFNNITVDSTGKISVSNGSYNPTDPEYKIIEALRINRNNTEYINIYNLLSLILLKIKNN